MKQRERKAGFELDDDGFILARRKRYADHIRRADLAFDLIAQRREMRFDGGIEISLFYGFRFWDGEPRVNSKR
jgi:hypothetical protein